METTVGIIGYILGLYWDNGKNGNCYSLRVEVCENVRVFGGLGFGPLG